MSSLLRRSILAPPRLRPRPRLHDSLQQFPSKSWNSSIECYAVQHRFTFGLRAIHTSPSSQEYQPLPYCNWSQVRDYHILKRDWDKSITLLNLPPFVIEEDTRGLLHESGFPADVIVMRFMGSNINLFRCLVVIVVFSTAEQASRAQKELNEAPLFDKRIIVRPYDPLERTSEIDFGWGWYAASQPGLKHLRLRVPLTCHPTDVRSIPLVDTECFASHVLYRRYVLL
jgi:hypothetical protein